MPLHPNEQAVLDKIDSLAADLLGGPALNWKSLTPDPTWAKRDFERHDGLRLTFSRRNYGIITGRPDAIVVEASYYTPRFGGIDLYWHRRKCQCVVPLVGMGNAEAARKIAALVLRPAEKALAAEIEVARQRDNKQADGMARLLSHRLCRSVRDISTGGNKGDVVAVRSRVGLGAIIVHRTAIDVPTTIKMELRDVPLDLALAFLDLMQAAEAKKTDA